MTDTTDTTETPSRWELLRDTWTEQDPSDDVREELSRRSELIKALLALESLTGGNDVSNAMRVASRYMSTVASGTMTKMMYELVTSLDDPELELDDETKTTTATYLNSMVTVLAAALDGADRVLHGKAPSGEGSFTADLRDIFERKAAAREKAESADGTE